MSVLTAVLRWYLRRVDAWLRQAAAGPVAAQQRTFEHLLDRARGTWFGRRHDFAAIRTPDDFAKAVPIGDFVGQIDMFRRIEAGERDVSWPGKAPYFAQTSGTTAGDKHIPVTRDMMRANRRAALAIFAYYARRPDADVGRLFKAKLLFLGGSTILTETEGGGLLGDLSGIATRSIFWPITRHYEPGKKLALLDSWEQKVEKVARREADLDVRFVTGMPSWVKILFDRICQLRGVDPAGGMSTVWPHMELFVHGGVNFAPFRRSFEGYFAPGHRLEFEEVYPASEGFVAIQAEAGEPGMELLTDNGLFFEFVPLSQWGEPGAPRLTLREVTTDVPYSVVLSTCAGLWAYDLGDVVRFTSVRPPRIVFAGRNKHFINAFGENIIGEQVSSAVAAAAKETGAAVAEYTAAPLYPGEGRRVGAHQYVIEFDRLPAGGEAAFATAVDAELKRLNNDYSVKRAGEVGMTCVEVAAVAEGTFYEWMKRRGKLGGQHKVPVCANDRRYVDELLAVARDRG